MDIFEATLLNPQQIDINSNTVWEAFSVGNFKLSKYFGNGDDTINILIPEDTYESKGTVYFKFGQEKCIYPNVDILCTNNCYIATIPNAKKCDIEHPLNRDVFLYFKDDKEVMQLIISNKVQNWSISNANGYTYFLEGNRILIVSNGNEGHMTINVNNCATLTIRILEKS